MAAIAPVHTMAGTTEMTEPALQRSEPNAQEDSQLMDIAATSYSFIKDL